MEGFFPDRGMFNGESVQIGEGQIFQFPFRRGSPDAQNAVFWNCRGDGLPQTDSDSVFQNHGRKKRNQCGEVECPVPQRIAFFQAGAEPAGLAGLQRTIPGAARIECVGELSAGVNARLQNQRVRSGIPGGADSVTGGAEDDFFVDLQFFLQDDFLKRWLPPFIPDAENCTGFSGGIASFPPGRSRRALQKRMKVNYSIILNNIL